VGIKLLLAFCDLDVMAFGIGHDHWKQGVNRNGLQVVHYDGMFALAEFAFGHGRIFFYITLRSSS
jgi:hypothetical protein